MNTKDKTMKTIKTAMELAKGNEAMTDFVSLIGELAGTLHSDVKVNARVGQEEDGEFASLMHLVLTDRVAFVPYMVGGAPCLVIRSIRCGDFILDLTRIERMTQKVDDSSGWVTYHTFRFRQNGQFDCILDIAVNKS